MNVCVCGMSRRCVWILLDISVGWCGVSLCVPLLGYVCDCSVAKGEGTWCLGVCLQSVCSVGWKADVPCLL